MSFTAIWSGVTSLLTLIGESIGLIKKSQELNNTPEMQKADQNKKETKQNDDIGAAIEERDVDAIRKHLSD